MKTTMEDIAKTVGVSRTTVSRVLSGKDVHSEETRDRILEVAKQLNYSTNLLARAIKTNRTGNIGVIINSEHRQVVLSPFYSPILEAILEEAKELGYGLFILSDRDIEAPAAESLIERRVDGVILISSIGEKVIERFRKNGIPVVIVNHVIRYENLPYIIFDEYKGVYEGVKYLIKKGHKRILHIGGSITSRCYIKRYEAFVAALTDAGIKPDPELIVFGTSVYKNGYDNMKNILQSNKLPTAVFAANDMIAIGAMRAIYEEGLKVPDDLEILGFDDIELSKLIIPALSTVHVPKGDMGMKAVKMLNEMINGNEVEKGEILLPTSLIIRESCKF